MVTWETAEAEEPSETGLQTVIAYERHDETTFSFGDARISPQRSVPGESARAFDEIAPAPGLPMTMTVPLRLENDARPPGTPGSGRDPVGVFQWRSATLIQAGATLRDSWFLGTGVALLPEGSLSKTCAWSPSIFAAGATGQRYGAAARPFSRIALGGAITGGTGAYAGARGEFRVIGQNPNAGRLVYRFTTAGPLWPGEPPQPIAILE